MPSKFPNFLAKPIRNTPLILIVDDNEDNILFASGSLQILNLRYIVAKDGEAALEMAQNELPDLILLDIVMPKMNGITVTKILKSNARTAQIPIVAVTGLTYLPQKQKIVEAGCDDYLCKPYLIEDLADKLSRLLQIETAELSPKQS